MEASVVLPAVSLRVTVAVAAAASATSGVPETIPVAASIMSPEGRPVALYSSTPSAPAGVIGSIASPTLSVAGAV